MTMPRLREVLALTDPVFLLAQARGRIRHAGGRAGRGLTRRFVQLPGAYYVAPFVRCRAGAEERLLTLERKNNIATDEHG
jgi:hypothetical protein